ncbi:MAG TPA: efflux RND transporter periplasmic adaptor subunit [Phycisphaerae bacterium]|nr:efflux RND transporter periplasmic adaptor subunit [Phycisphaerae bacterium]
MEPPTIPKKRLARRVIRRLVPALVVLAAAGGVALLAIALPEKSRQAPPAETPPVNVVVEVVHALGELPDVLELNGTVEPYLVVKVAAEVPGRIERYADRRHVPAGAVGQPLAEGDTVEANAPLVYLNTELLQAEYDRAKAKLLYDRNELRRFLDAVERGVATATELDGAQTALAVSEATFAASKAQLDRAVIYAPIGGILNKLPAKVGEYVKAGDPVAELVQSDKVKVVVDVPELDVHYLKVADTHDVFDKLGRSSGRVTGEANMAGEITYIDALADKLAHTTRVELTVDNRDRRLRNGQIVSVRLTRRVLKDAITIPLKAVIAQEQGYQVFVNEGGKAAEHDVKLGFLTGHRVLVTDGLRPGDRLITDGHRFVSPGQKVAERDPNMLASEPAAPLISEGPK